MASGSDSEGEIKGPVLVASHSYGYGGDLMYYGAIFAALRRHEPRLAIAVDSATPYRNPQGLDLRPLYRRRSFALPATSGYDRALHLASPRLATRVAQLAPEVLVAIEFTPVALLAMVGTRAVPHSRRVLLIESDPRLRGASSSAPALAIKRFAVAHSHAILTSNDAGARYLVDVLRADPVRVAVGPYLTSHPPGPEPSLAPSSGPVRLLFANTLNERKNPAVMIEALALLPAAARTQVTLTIVGEGELRRQLEQRVAELGLNAAVSFAGHCPYAELGGYFADADVLINPTRADYRSLSGFEGLGYGLALLVSNRDGAARETVIDGRTGYTFAPDDAVGLARLIEVFVHDRQRLATMRHNALDLYRQRFSVERAAANLAAAIDRARRA